MAKKKTRSSRNRTARPAGKAVVQRRARPARARGVKRDIPTAPTPPPTDTLTVVAIGASAGGLEAMTRLVQQLRPDAGMAYVVVQHLAPKHESMLPALLSVSSTVPVVQVTEAMPLERNRVHVIPPNVHMTVMKGRLHLAPRPLDDTQHSPINSFFESLAQYAGPRAIGVVLSGSASDGAQGLAHIKSAGGIAIAQDPKSAKYDGMPRAAIATGVVDLVLPPQAIAEELTRLVQHPYLGRAEEASSKGDFDEPQLAALFRLLKTASGVDFTHYKLPTIRRRLQRRMVLHRTTTLDDYLKVLEREPDEVRNLYRDLLIHVTRFFRDPESFDAMQKLVFPRILAESPRRPIRIWVPGCATGEEAYSVAIALLEYLGDRAASVAIQVFATDVSEEAVERARAGVYAQSIEADVSAERLRRFFTRSDGRYRINKIVRDSCIFARQDLTRDPPFSKLDLIVCRNVLIYLGLPLQRRLMNVFHYALKQSGFLALGASESVGAQGELFALLNKKYRIYTKRSATGTGAGHITVDAFDGAFEKRAHARVAQPARRELRGHDLQSEVTRLIVSRYGPPAVVVDSELHVVQTRGKTGAYLELAAGEPSLNVLKLAREGLLHGLRSALQEAQRTLKPTRRNGLTVRLNGNSRDVEVQVIPIGDLAEMPFFLILFEPPREGKDEVPPPAKGKRGRAAEDRLSHMRQELSTSRDYLQSIIQDLEAANEELQSANEEILSSNEELQSTNEELDTAKEELQSTNEELNTVNEELNARNEELSHVNSDLINLLTAVPAAIVIVSADLRVRRFTPLAEQVLNLIPTDVGRPIGDLKPNIDAPDLEDLTREVIDSVTPKQLVVRDRTGRQYSVRVRPYKNQESRIDGAVLAFTEQVDAQQGLLAEHRFVEAVLSMTPCGLLVIDEDLRVRFANAAGVAMLGEAAPASVEGRRVVDIAGAQLDDTELMAQITRSFSRREPFGGIMLRLPQSRRQIRIEGRPLDGHYSDSTLVLLSLHAVP